MTSITHSFVSEKSDGGDATLVRPSDWNADHVVDGSLTGSGLLAYKAITVGDFTSISGASLADLDATNALVTFTAPPSGAVMVRLSASTASPSGSSGSYQSWGLRESSTNIAGGAGDSIASRSVGTADQYVGASKVFVLTGLTPGSSHTYKWSVAQSAGTGIIKANASSPAIMEVWDALTGGVVLTGTRVVRGRVNADGTVGGGTGFSSVKDTTGNYTVTFDTPFSTTPAIVVTAVTTSFRLGRVQTSAAGSFSTNLSTPNTGTDADTPFDFIAIERSTGGDSNAPLASGVVRLTSGNFSTSSLTFVDVTGALVTLVTGARRCRVTVSGSTSNNDTSHNGFDIEVDGTRIGAASAYGLELTRVAAGGDWAAMSFTVDTDVLTAGSHTFKLKMRVGGGTGTLAANTTLSALVMSVTELSSSTAATNTGPPNELDYVPFTSPVNLTATTADTANTIVTSSAITYDGVTPVIIECWFPYISDPDGQVVVIQLYEDGAKIGRIGYQYQNSEDQQHDTLHGFRRLTPSAGSHTYSIRGWVTGGTGVAGAGAGGSDNFMPGFIRITRAQLNGGAPPAVIAARAVNAGFSVPDSAWTGVNLSSTTYDTRTIVSTVSSITRFTAPASGFFRVAAWGGYNANGTGSQRYTAIYKNGTLYSSQGGVANAFTNGIPGLPVNDLVPVVAGDRVELWAYQDSGGSLSLSARMAVEFVT